MKPSKNVLKRLSVLRRNQNKFDKLKEDCVPLTSSSATVCTETTDDLSISTTNHYYSCDPFEWSQPTQKEAIVSSRVQEEDSRTFSVPEAVAISYDKVSKSKDELKEGASARSLSAQADSSIQTIEFPAFTSPANPTNPNSSRDTESIKICVLLLHPKEKTFELIQVNGSTSTSTVRDLLNNVPEIASEPSLASQIYTGLCHSDDGARITNENLKDVSDDTILFAIPEGYSSDRITLLGKQILTSRSMTKVLRRLQRRRSRGRSSSNIQTRSMNQLSPTGISEISKKPKETGSFSSEGKSSTFPNKLVSAHVLLLDPKFRMFEMIEIEYSLSTSSVLDVLGRVPYIATRAELGCIRYVGLCNPINGVDVTDDSLEANRKRNVLVAIPKGYTTDKVVTYGLQILSSRKMAKVLTKSGLQVPPKKPLKPLSKSADNDRDTLDRATVTPSKKSHRKSDSLSVLSETDSLPAMLSASSVGSSLDMSLSTISHHSMHSLELSSPLDNSLYSSMSTSCTVASHKSHKSKRIRRAQRQAFVVRALAVAVAFMGAIYKMNPFASSGAAHHSLGLTGLFQAALFLVGMVAVQRMAQESNGCRQAHTTASERSCIPHTVLIEADDDELSCSPSRSASSSSAVDSPFVFQFKTVDE